MAYVYTRYAFASNNTESWTYRKKRYPCTQDVKASNDLIFLHGSFSQCLFYCFGILPRIMGTTWRLPTLYFASTLNRNIADLPRFANL